MLEPTQETLLTALAGAAKRIPPEAREPFVVSPTAGRARYLTISHSHLPEALEAYQGDVHALEHADLIRVYDRESSSVFVFDVTSVGQRKGSAETGTAAPEVAPAGARPDRRRWGRWVAVDDKPFKTSAMSALWRVRDEADEARTIRALKTLKYAKGRGSAAYRRFAREIDALANVLHGRHPGIVDVLDHSAPREGDTREPYYVMPMANGSLKDLARDLRGELAPALRKLIPVAEALGVAHAGDVIHRDIKPDNVLLFDGTPVLADFGICFLEEADRVTRTEAETVGTDDYVAPELLGGGRSEAVTAAADVYSFGKTLFAVVSGGDVFPREDYDDDRFNLVERFKRPELRHLRGLMERMVTKDPLARPQSMAEVKQLLETALANLDEREAYREGMYADGTGAVLRGRQVRRVLATMSDRPRRDALHAEIEQSVAAAVTTADQYGDIRGGMPVGRPHEPAMLAAAAAAEDLLAVGLPLVEADDRDGFEEWLGAVLEPLTRQDGHQYAANRLILHAAAVLAAHAAGAVAWRRRRFELLRLIVDQYVANDARWMHQEILGRSSAALIPWVTQALSSSEILRWFDSALAATPGPAVSMLNGLVVLRLLAEVDAAAFDKFAKSRNKNDNPLPFAPGFMDLQWVPELLALGLQGGPVERDLARAVFDRSAEELRRMCGELGGRLEFVQNHVLHHTGRAPYLGLGINTREWERWTGTALPPFLPTLR